MDLSGSNSPIIIDNGSGIVKAGFATDATPKCIIQNSVARPKVGDVKSDVIIGAQNDLHKLSISYPMEKGVVQNWDDMEKVWNYVYGKSQLDAFSEEHPVLLTETAFNPRTNRNKIIEIFYEKFNVPALSISLQAVLSLYSTGRTTGVVLDVGDTVSQVVPICQGFALADAVRRIDLGGRDITRYLRLLLKKEGVNLQSTGDLEIIRNIKESLCYIPVNSVDEESSRIGAVEYTLPDGKCVSVGSSRFRAPEALFRPVLIGDESVGLHEILYESIQSADLDLRRTLMRNVVISGGSTLCKGFGKRIFTEMKNIFPKDAQVKVSAPKERLYSAWIGGSVLASLDSFKDAFVTKKDYEEHGKCHAFNKAHAHGLLDHYYMMFHKH